jgi:FkbM family methyltransferase
LRAISTHYPLWFGAAWLNKRLGRFFDRAESNWLLAPGRGLFPTMVLDVATTLQRKLYYFPKYYGRFYGRTSFAAYLRHKLVRGSRYIDIGSNVGFYALTAARIVGPDGRVVAFEPEPNICESLVRSARANDFSYLRALPVALSDHEGEACFYRARDGTASSLVCEAPGREARYERTLTTQVTTLDKLVAAGEVDVTQTTLIKVDVEGEEVRTIRGMREMLAAAAFPSIWCEVRGLEGSTRAPNTYAGVRDALEPLGYRPFLWTDGVRRPVVDKDIRARVDVLFERT